MPLLLDANDIFTFKAYFVPKTVGLLSSDVVADTSNAVTGFSANTPITLKGTANSAAPVLQCSWVTCRVSVTRWIIIDSIHGPELLLW